MPHSGRRLTRSRRNGDEQHHDLGHRAQRHADAEDEQLRVAHLHRIHRKFAGDNEIETERGDRDDVVAHRRPGGRPEYVAGVEDRHEHRRQPVEQHLRQQEIGERRGELAVHLGVVAEHQLDQQRRRRDGQRGGEQQQRRRQGDQTAHECRAAVGVVAFGAGEHGHEDRGERRLQHQRGDQVGQLVGHREGTGQCGTEDGGDQHDAGESGEPADQGCERHAPRAGHHRGVGSSGRPARRRGAGPRGSRGGVERRPASRRWGTGCRIAWADRTGVAGGVSGLAPPRSTRGVGPGRPCRPGTHCSKSRGRYSFAAAAGGAGRRIAPIRRRSAVRPRAGPAGRGRRGRADRGTGATAGGRPAARGSRPPDSVMKNSTLP